tara:strand:- start:346 stop:477 length:132 start_codon:yes stop_codon:yes gene_type:complete
VADLESLYIDSVLAISIADAVEQAAHKIDIVIIFFIENPFYIN